MNEYQAETITVQYGVRRCIHAAECGQRLSQVFDSRKRPWVDPTNASADEIAAAVEACPSGALHYIRHDSGTAEQPVAANTVRMVANGPLYIRGDLELVLGDEVVLQETRVALCRCGASNNKPFCDNTHKDISFTHDGIVNPEKYKISEINGGGKLVITPTSNGSVKIEGDFEITDASGALIYQGSKTWLCRCGGSASKPFCDGSHKTNDFTAAGK
ncbi:MAG: CDGSH iron-sulfur domain-containing protein [Anaerolineae bacterium]|nr:CDGSH iron-sulfur domain-containing protein [Anaerolineae bacterium]